MLTNLLAITIAIFLAGSPESNVMTGTILSFPIYTGAIMWAFSAKTVWKAWMGLFIPSLACVAIISLSIAWNLL